MSLLTGVVLLQVIAACIQLAEREGEALYRSSRPAHSDNAGAGCLFLRKGLSTRMCAQRLHVKCNTLYKCH